MSYCWRRQQKTQQVQSTSVSRRFLEVGKDIGKGVVDWGVAENKKKVEGYVKAKIRNMFRVEGGIWGAGGPVQG